MTAGGECHVSGQIGQLARPSEQDGGRVRGCRAGVFAAHAVALAARWGCQAAASVRGNLRVPGRGSRRCPPAAAKSSYQSCDGRCAHGAAGVWWAIVGPGEMPRENGFRPLQPLEADKCGRSKARVAEPGERVGQRERLVSARRLGCAMAIDALDANKGIERMRSRGAAGFGMRNWAGYWRAITFHARRPTSIG